ncbi:MAG: RNA polymerase sigma factor [Faecousia sp.]
MITLPLMILAIENDDDRAFITQIYLKYRKLMYAVAIDIVRDSHIADDMVASAITEMIEGIDTLRRINCSRMRSYIASIVRNNSIDYVRKRDRQGKYVFIPDDEELINQIPADGAVDDRILQTVEIEILRKSVSMLHLRERTLLQMKYVDDKDDKAIARTLNIGQDSVRAYLSRARRALSTVLYRWGMLLPPA